MTAKIQGIMAEAGRQKLQILSFVYDNSKEK